MAFAHGYLASWKFLFVLKRMSKIHTTTNQSVMTQLFEKLSYGKFNFEGVNLSFIGILYFKFRVFEFGLFKTTFQRC